MRERLKRSPPDVMQALAYWATTHGRPPALPFSCREQQSVTPNRFSPFALWPHLQFRHYISRMKNDHWPPRRRAFTLGMGLIKEDFDLARASARRIAVQRLVEPIKRGANTEAARIAARTRWLKAFAALSFWAIVCRSKVKPPPTGPLGS